MFDILTDEWAHPGTAGAPVITFDISKVSADEADARISDIHKHGIDSLYLICAEKYSHDSLSAILSAMAKRFMLAYIDESIILSHVGWSDGEMHLYNPMLGSHTLRIAPHGERIAEGEEIALSAELLIENGAVSDNKNSSENAPLRSYDFILTSGGEGLDLLCPESGELLCAAYDVFFAELDEMHRSAFAGIVSNRLTSFDGEMLCWSYDMTEDFSYLGGNGAMLASLILGTEDKRLKKESTRIYSKALARRLDSAYCKPVSEWCKRRGIAFAGEVPYRFFATCGRRFSLPTVTRNFSPETSASDTGFMTAVKCFADTARGEGGAGCAYRCELSAVDELMKEAMLFFAASGTLMILPESLSDTEYIGSMGLEKADTKKILRRIRRLSMLGVACRGGSECAVLLEDRFIPFAGAEKLLDGGYDFTFVPVPQLMDRGCVQGGELLLDKYSYSTVLIEPRVRLSPMEIKKIGELPANGGNMYRGASFGEYMKKHFTSSLLAGAKGERLYRYEASKGGIPFALVLNPGESPVTVDISREHTGRVYELDVDSGKSTPVAVLSDSDKHYLRRRLMPWECAVFVWNGKELPQDGGAAHGAVCEIVSLREGENILTLNHGGVLRARLEADSIGEVPVEVSVNGHNVGRVPCVPYSLDISEYISKENTVVMKGKAQGACVRITHSK